MTTSEFNYHKQRIRKDPNSLAALYTYSVGVIKVFITKRFGTVNFDDTLPHDIFTKCMIEKDEQKYIELPVAWLCKIAENTMLSRLKLKDNNTLELLEDYVYNNPEYTKSLDIDIPVLYEAFHSLDKESQYILHLVFVHKFQLNEIAYMMDKKDTYVRTKKSRAMKILKLAATNCGKQNNKNLLEVVK